MNFPSIKRVLVLSVLFALGASAREIVLTRSGDLQLAIDQALPGDVILLEPGAVYRGNFRLPAKAAGPAITIQTNGPIPAGRVNPSVALARIVAPNVAPALEFLPNADNYRMVGVEVTVDAGIYSYEVIRVGSLTATSIEDQPDNITFDRVYLHGDPSVGSKRGMMLSTNRVQVQRSYISDFKAKGQDTQAIAVGNAVGPITVQDNYLEAAGYPMIFGGSKNNIPEIVPTGLVSNNHFTRPLSWKEEGWTVKNLFEIKFGRNISVENNLFENNWVDAQQGFAIFITARYEGLGTDGEYFTRVENITFRDNVVRNSPSGINVLDVHGLRVENNLFVDVPDRLFQLLGETQNVELLFNTALDTQNLALISDPSTGSSIGGFIMRGNILNLGTYGIYGSSLSSGNSTIAAHYSDPEIDHNVFVRGNQTTYPEGNYFLAKVEDLRLSGYALPSDSPYKGIVDGRDPGVSLWAPPPPEPEVVVSPGSTEVKPVAGCRTALPELILGQPVNVDYRTVEFTVTIVNTDSEACGPSSFVVDVSPKRPLALVDLDISQYTTTLDAGAYDSTTVTASLKWRRPKRVAINAKVTRQ